jgi:hypothetical protein
MKLYQIDKLLTRDLGREKEVASQRNWGRVYLDLVAGRQLDLGPASGHRRQVLRAALPADCGEGRCLAAGDLGPPPTSSKFPNPNPSPVSHSSRLEENNQKKSTSSL